MLDDKVGIAQRVVSNCVSYHFSLLDFISISLSFSSSLLLLLLLLSSSSYFVKLLSCPNVNPQVVRYYWFFFSSSSPLHWAGGVSKQLSHTQLAARSNHNTLKPQVQQLWTSIQALKYFFTLSGLRCVAVCFQMLRLESILFFSG